MTNYSRPGVYIEEIPSLPPSVIPAETAIPAFIGYTGEPADTTLNYADDIKLKPIKIDRMQDYERYFGRPLKETTSITVELKEDASGNVIPESVFAKVDEAKRSKHIMHYALQAYFLNGGGSCWVVSVAKDKSTDNINLGSESGSDGLRHGLKKIELIDEVTILIFPEAFGMNNDDRKTLYNLALTQCDKKKNRFLIADASPKIGTESDDIADNFRTNLISYNFLKYGAAYLPNLKTVLNYEINDVEIDVEKTPASGEDPPKLIDYKSDNLALYNQIVSTINELPIELPPSPLMAGIYAQVDRTRGVFKAPANVSLTGVVAPSLKISDAEHDKLNIHTSGKSINAIRSFPNRGTLVFGARTLAGNDNEWRYIPVRRFFNFAEISIKNTIEQFLFEPNDSNTWERVKAMISNFLTIQWKEGALVGDNPQQAFFVNVGLGSTMTPIDITEGRMNVEIGMAVVRPAEFIILKFSHLMQIS